MSIETIQDRMLGSLTWDVRRDEWSGQSAMMDGTQFRLSVRTPADNQLPAMVATNPDKTITKAARDTFQRIQLGDTQVRIKVADKMLDRYSRWHDGETISSEDFQARLQLDSITIKADGTAAIYYMDDKMFFGHFIIAHLDSDETLTHVELFG